MADQFTVTLDQDDFIDAYRPAPRSKRASAILLSAAAVLALIILTLVIAFPEARQPFSDSPLIIGLTGAVILAGVLVLALLIAAPWLRRRAARNTLRDHPGMADPVQYRFDDDGFSVKTTYTQARYPWATMWDWRETGRIVLIWPTPRNFYVLPKRGLDPAAVDRLRGYLARTRKRTGP